MALEHGTRHSAAAKLPFLGCIEKIRQQEEPPSSRLVICCPTIQMLLASDPACLVAKCAAGRSCLASI